MLPQRVPASSAVLYFLRERKHSQLFVLVSRKKSTRVGLGFENSTKFRAMSYELISLTHTHSLSFCVHYIHHIIARNAIPILEHMATKQHATELEFGCNHDAGAPHAFPSFNCCLYLHGMSAEFPTTPTMSALPGVGDRGRPVSSQASTFAGEDVSNQDASNLASKPLPNIVGLEGVSYSRCVTYSPRNVDID